MREYFEQLKRNLEPNDSFEKIVSQRHTAVRSAIENLTTIQDTKLIGSLQRKTRIQPRTQDTFDVDILVILGNFIHWTALGQGITADAALNRVMSAVEKSDRYSTKNPTEDAPTITLHFKDGIKVELVPAYIDNIGHTSDGVSTLPDGRGYWVPGPGGRWIHADYDFDADYVTRINKAYGNRVVPIIKMLKAAKRHNFVQLRSFPLEIIAVHAIPAILSVREQQGLRSPTDAELIKLFFMVGKGLLSGGLRIPGSNSPDVFLGAETAAAVAGRFDDVINHIEETERLSTEAAKVDALRRLFGDAFPTRVTPTYERTLHQ